MGGAIHVVGSVLGWLLLAVLAFWGLLASLIAQALVRSRGSRMALTAILTAAPIVILFGLLEYSSWQSQRRSDELRKFNAQFARAADDYLAMACAKERVLRSPMPVVRAGGVLIAVNPDQELDLPDAPPPPAETQHKRFGTNNGGASLSGMHRRQYKTPVGWGRHFLPDGVLIRSEFAFVESQRWSSSESLEITARKRWWRDHGAARTQDPTWLGHQLERMSEDSWLTRPTMDSQARYKLSVEDISTTEDRTHWVGRARIRLTETKTGAVAAEYVGFVAEHGAAYEPHWDYAWTHAVPCPGKEQQYLQKGRWGVVDFFFREVVAYDMAE